MAGHGVVCGSGNVLRELVLVVEAEPDVDPDEVGRLIRQLRAELKHLDVESIAPVSSEKAPPGAKGIDPFSLGGLLITLSASGGVFTVVIERRRMSRRCGKSSTSVLEPVISQPSVNAIASYGHLRHEGT